MSCARKLLLARKSLSLQEVHSPRDSFGLAQQFVAAGQGGFATAALHRMFASVAVRCSLHKLNSLNAFHAGLLSFPMAPAHLDHLSNFLPPPPPPARPRTSARGSPAPPRAPPPSSSPSTARHQDGRAVRGMAAEEGVAVEGRGAGAASGARDQAGRDGGGSNGASARGGAGWSAGADVTREEVVAMQRALLLSREAGGRGGGRDGGWRAQTSGENHGIAAAGPGATHVQVRCRSAASVWASADCEGASVGSAPRLFLLLAQRARQHGA